VNFTYPYGPITVRVKATPPQDAYIVSLEMGDFVSSNILIDAHWGADHASKFALETYLHAFTEPEAFMAQERLEASRSRPQEVQAAEQWASTVIHEAKVFGNALREARRAATIVPVEDISAQVNTYLELMEFAWQAEIETFLAKGYSRSEAEREVAKKRFERTQKRWMYVPRLRPPRGMRT
jgi:hypothetical protein